MGILGRELLLSVRPRVLISKAGPLLRVLAGLMVPPFVVALMAREHAFLMPLGVAGLVLLAAGMALRRVQLDAELRRNEAVVLATGAYLVASLAMAPALAASGIPLHEALFEAVSGVTTTGLSTVRGVQGMPRSFLFLRAWMQWFGGLGFVAAAVALFLRPGWDAKALTAAVGTSGSDRSSVRWQARRVLQAYVAFTAISWGVLALAGVGAFQALVLAFASVSTGGFAPHDLSLGALEGSLGPALVIASCVLGAVPAAAALKAWNGDASSLWRDPTLRVLLALAAVWTGMILALEASAGAGGEVGWGDAALLALSAQSTAGFSSCDPASLSPGARLLLCVPMFLGGGAGSTAGGVKILRVLILIQSIRVLIRRASVSPHGVLELRVGARSVEDEEVREALLVVLLFFCVVAVSWFPFVVMGLDPLDSLFEVVSATGTVGLSTGVTQAGMPRLLLGILGLDMLLGRLEVVVWLVLLDPRAWIRPAGKE